MSPKTVARPLDIYVRVSDRRGRSGDSFISPKDQEERCRALAKSRGFEVGDVFYDEDVSGGKMRRPELDNAIRRIEEGVSSGIIVAKLDRFARTLVGGLQTLEQINNLGGVVIVADGEFDTSTATGELVLNMMLSLAQFELRRIKDNWASAKRHAVIDNGIHISRRPPLGYLRGDDRRLVVDPVTAPAVREAFTLAAGGEHYARIADEMSRRGVPMQSNRVKRILANRAYLGEARNGHGDIRPEAHEPLVDAAVWNLAQRTPTGPTPAGGRAEALLAGIARCASCSFAMRSQKARGGAIATYRCGCTTTLEGRCPHPTTIGMDRFEEYVIEQFLAHVGQTRLAPADEDDTAAAEATQAALAAERSYRSALTDVELRERIGDADHAQMVASLHARWQQLLAAIPAPTGSAAIGDDVDLHQLVDDLRADGATAELRDLIGSTVAAVFVRPSLTPDGKADRSRNKPIADRVKIVYRGAETLELPRRGERFEPRPYTW